MVTSSLQLELARDRRTDTFLAALRRFIARRVKPAEMYSDNGRNFGRNFVGAKRALNEMLQLHTSREHNERVTRKLSEQSIKWYLIPQYSSHWGGKWKSAVRSVKVHLRQVMMITFEHTAYTDRGSRKVASIMRNYRQRNWILVTRQCFKDFGN